MFSLFESKAKAKENFYANQRASWLAISFNDTPKYGEVHQILNYNLEDQSHSIESTYSNEKIVHLIGTKCFTYTHGEINEHKRLESFKQKLISQAINESIIKLKAFQPAPLADEQKAWEWFRVSMDVLIKGIGSIDHDKTILQYKLFWGERNDEYLARLIMYNLDIKFSFLTDGIQVCVYNNKPGEDSQKPAQKVIIKGHYNDFFNKFIEVLKAIKERESSL